MIKKIRGFDLAKVQTGWVCACCFTVETANQFTPEECSVSSDGRWVLTALWNSYRAAKSMAREMSAKPGERREKGWL